MTRSRGNLSHHEELRLDYLRKNIYYLNDSEIEELDYLEERLQGFVRPSRKASRPKTTYSELPSYREDHAREYESYDAYPDEGDILPTYPREERRRKVKGPKKEKIKKQKVKKQLPVREILASDTVQEEKVRKPRKKVNWFKQIFKIIIWAFLLTLIGLLFMFIKGYSSIEHKAKPETFQGQAARDGVNILVLGTDGREQTSGEGIRTDSIMVVNINNSDKKIKMVSFMRDTLINIQGNDYKLNLAYELGQQNGNKGAENLREVLEEFYGIEIQHYVMIDFSTFATAIDTVFPNGVAMDAKFSTIAGQAVSSVEVPDDLGFASGGKPYQTIQVGKQQMNGKTLLNYARFRSDDEGDFGRTRRQQEVMAAIMTQVKDPTKLFTGSEALGKVYALTPTTISPLFMITNGLPAALDASNGVVQTTVPEMGDWVDAYDVYGGLGLEVDFVKYKERLAELGFR